MVKKTKTKAPNDTVRKTMEFKGDDELKMLDDFIKKSYKENRDFTKGVKQLIKNDLQ